MKKKLQLAAACVLAVALVCVAGCAKKASEYAMVDDGYQPSVTGGYGSGNAVLYDSSSYYMTESEAPAGMMPTYIPDDWFPENTPWNTEEYAVVKQHGFTSVAAQPFSTFSADIDTASYCNLRRMIRDGWTMDEIPSGAARVEEMLNYFNWDIDDPFPGDPFGATMQMGDCPWNPDTKLLFIGLKAAEADPDANAGNNLVFLIDISGSMASRDKLPLLQETFRYLVKNVGPNDTVSIVTYASGEKVVLEGATSRDKRAILRAIDSLRADGSTNGQAGLAMAYEVAERHFIEGGNNRIIMASDGDLNVGITSQSDLSDFVSAKRDSGIFLSVLGFGDGNYKDNKMETLADDGNGAYYYIDCPEEAQRIFGENLMSTMYTVAQDVKFQIEFNPAYVKGYRQIGYENRELSADDFKNDKVDGGEVGSGCQIVVAYELVMTDSPMQLFAEESRYGGTASSGAETGELFCLHIRYKEPGALTTDEAKQCTYVFTENNSISEPNEDWEFAAKVIQFWMLLTGNENLGTTTLADLKEELLTAHYEDSLRAEFAQLVCRII